MLDERKGISYPDGFQAPDGTIFISYDRNRDTDGEILLARFTEADVRVAEDDELLGLMRDSGCQQVLIGLESPSRTSLSGVELKNDWKLRQHDFYRAAIEKIQSHGVTVNGCFILGLDGDTRDVFADVLAFVRDSALYEVQVTFLTAFPGTPLYARLKNEGRILRDRAWELCTLFDVNFQPKNMSLAELQTGFLDLVKRLYSAGETHARRDNFKRRLKTSPHFGRNVKRAERPLAAQQFDCLPEQSGSQGETNPFQS